MTPAGTGGGASIGISSGTQERQDKRMVLAVHGEPQRRRREKQSAISRAMVGGPPIKHLHLGALCTPTGTRVRIVAFSRAHKLSDHYL